MVEFVRVSKSCSGEDEKRVEFVCIPKNNRIRVRTGKTWILCEYRKTVRASIEKGFNQCVYRNMVESGSLPEKGRFVASIEKLLGRVTGKGSISMCTEKL